MGTITRDRYDVVRLLGAGADAEVHLARDRETGQEVALKFPRFLDGQAASGILEEARLATRVGHPGVVRVFGIGDDDGRPFIVMEHLTGQTLRDVLTERGSLPPAEAVAVVVEVAEAVQAIHDASIIHNDLKPENVVLADGHPRITDFGVARDLRRTLAPEGAAGLAGTLPYIAPEVVQGAGPSRASDVYALGVIAYELLTGTIPFAGLTPLLRQMNGLSGPEPIRNFAPGVDPRIEAAVMRALSPRPRDRFASASAFAAAVAMAGAARRSPPVGERNANTAAGGLWGTPHARPSRSRNGGGRRQHPGISGTRLVMASGFAVAALAVAGVVALARPSGGGSAGEADGAGDEDRAAAAIATQAVAPPTLDPPTVVPEPTPVADDDDDNERDSKRDKKRGKAHGHGDDDGDD